MTDEDRKRIAARIDLEFPHQVLLPLMIDADTEAAKKEMHMNDYNTSKLIVPLSRIG